MNKLATATAIILIVAALGLALVPSVVTQAEAEKPTTSCDNPGFAARLAHAPRVACVLIP